MATPNRPPVAATVYHVEASVTVKLLGSDCDGKILLEVDPGHLRSEDVVALALQALADEVVEWFMPTPLRPPFRGDEGGLPPPGVIAQHQPQTD